MGNLERTYPSLLERGLRTPTFLVILRLAEGLSTEEGWAVIREYADRAITGADSSRPQYREMLSAADRGEFDILLVDDLSRLAREQVESERAIRRLEFRGIRIVATADGYDSQTKTATRKIQRTVKGLVNEMRLDELREQVRPRARRRPSTNYAQDPIGGARTAWENPA